MHKTMTTLPDKKELYAIGYFSKLHGYKGELTAALDTGDIHDYEDLEILFLDLRGTLVPYFVESLEYKTNTAAKVKLEGIDTEEKAKALVKSTIYIKRSDMSAPDTDRAALRAISGYKVFDAVHGEIGVVDHIEESPNNPLLVIRSGKKEILLPLNGDFFESIDDEKREVHIDAPEGLIDFYLSQ
jgi:16S rRNA processing protein RimM